MFRTNLPLQRFRLVYFPIQITLEITLAVLFLALKIYSENVPLNFGYLTLWGWVLASASIFIIILLFSLFFSGVSIKNRFSSFLSKEKHQFRLAFFLAYFCLLRIGLIAISLMFITPFYFDRTMIYLVIFCLSFFPPFLLYFTANCQSIPEKTYALSHESPISIKLTAFWLLFLTGSMQILSTEITILLVGLILLLVSYFFFHLYPSAIILTPLLLFIHASFSIFLSVVVLIQIDNPEILANIYTKSQVVLVVVLFFIIPGLISLALMIPFFHKKLHTWVRNLYPKNELALSLPSSYEEESEEEIENK